MRTLKLNLENCYGISKLQYDFDFTKKNIIVIYAANGTMKTSFANTFRDLSKRKSPSDRINGLPTICEVNDENNEKINPEDIIVVNPFDENLMQDQSKLMANQELQNEYLSLHKDLQVAKDMLFENVKEQLKYGPRTKFNIEEELSSDFKVPTKEIYSTLKLIKKIIEDKPKQSFDIKDVNHSILFSPQAVKFYNKNENHKLLEQYSKKYEELLMKSKFLVKGVFDHKNFSNIVGSLKDNGFFSARHKVIINSKDEENSFEPICDVNQLKKLLEDEKTRIINDIEIKKIFEKISAEIIANKETKELDAYLRDNSQFTIELENIENFKKKIWIEVLRDNKHQLDRLISLYDSTYSNIKALIEKAKKQETRWHDVINVFNDRFYLPFTIESTNLDDVILLDKAPAFNYKYSKGKASEKEIEEKELLNILSTGEKRAYYLLDLIYQIEIRKIENRPCLLILDDIADSFDYKNKYAIIEYLNDIISMKDCSGNNLFVVIILTHNFDFYRTVGSRLAGGKNCYIANVTENCIELENNEYLRNYFSYVKEQCLKNDEIFIIAAIPFIRNIIEYTYSKGDEQYLDYDILTSLLHIKKDTYNITIGTLQEIYNKYWLNNKGSFTLPDAKSVIKLINEVAEKIANTPKLIDSINVEYKIALSIAIRLKAEEIMISQISRYVEKGENIVKEIQSEKNQTAKLFDKYKNNKSCFPQNYERDLQKVVMMTPENIHINSFMYEPILDMHGAHLIKLYCLLRDFDS